MRRPLQGELALYRRLLLETRPFWPHIALLCGVSLLATPLTLLTPLPLKIAIDSVIGSEPLPPLIAPFVPDTITRSPMALLLLSAGFVVVVAVLSHVQGLVQWLLHAWTGERLVLGFRAQLFRHVQRLSLAYHDAKGTTDSTYRIQYDAPAIQYVTLDGVIPLVSAALKLIGMVYVTALIDWQLAMVAVAIVPVLFVLTHVSSHRLRARWFEVKELESSAMSVVQEALGAVRIVKAFGREDHEQGRFLHHATRSLRGHFQVAFVGGGFDVLVGTAIAVGTGATLLVGLLHVRGGLITVGEFLVVMAYLAQLYTPLEDVSKRVAVLQSSLASAERALALLDEAPDVDEAPDARPLARAAGAVEFRNVRFSYDGDRAALRDITFSVSPGTRVGIAGTTGSGKTTLVNLLTRFYDPQEGAILLDGVDIREYRVADVRNQFAIVLQEPVLFSTSITENIAYARPGATEADIVAAATAAGAHDFVVALPDGYRTVVGERGMRLSGGERQRIALARAFLKNAPILILDEPTSSVDIRTEAAIMQAMERLMHGRTTFMIAHRLSTLTGSDVLLVIERGRLARITTDVADVDLAAVDAAPVPAAPPDAARPS